MIKVFAVGPLQENTVIIADDTTKEAVIVDPGAEGEKILSKLEGLKPVAIINTHGHLDHVGQVGFLKKKLDIPFYLNKKDTYLINNDIFPGFAQLIGAVPCPAPDYNLEEGDEIPFGKRKFVVIETPGHTPGGVCFYDPDNKILISGDTLFRRGVGRTDLPGGDADTLKNSLKKLMELPEDTVVIAGHGDTTTIGEEKHHNPFITGRIELW
ncbi:MAG: MBL fold metallo-hydrolase [Aquificae bacterium]|nr:MBL fold metallo-hydrolase [Aquificota bacterium]